MNTRNTRLFFILVAVLALVLSSIACDDGGGVDNTQVQKTISDQAIVDNGAKSVWDFFFYDVVCKDPGNTMDQCH